MLNDKSEEKEFEAEKKTLEQKIEIEKEKIAEKIIKKGLGVEIKQTLRNPKKISKFQLFKIKINNFFKTLLDVL